LQITEEEENLIKIKNKNNGNDLIYKKLIDKNFDDTFYGYFRYDPNVEESHYKINGFGIRLNKNYKYIGEFKDGECYGYGIYYSTNGSYKLVNDLKLKQTYKFFSITGQIEFCHYNNIIENYQKNGVYYIELPNGTKKIFNVKNNNFDGFGIMYNANGEYYEGYHLSGVRHGYGIFNSKAEERIKSGIFYKGELKFGKLLYKDTITEGEFNMGLEDGYVI
jgi:hypothetical protein